MKIGITERGDASIDYQWVEKLPSVDGTILITKNLTDRFIDTVIKCYENGDKLIVHATCTGWGRTDFEPNVPDYKTQLHQLKKLIKKGFPADHCVLRIDPIFPTLSGLNRVMEVIHEFQKQKTGIKRIRISVYDEYHHVKERLKAAGYRPCYGENFHASPKQMESVANALRQFSYCTYSHHGQVTMRNQFETCAEDLLVKRYPHSFKQVGCVSNKDIELMGLEPVLNKEENGQQRTGCHCLTCKTELLTNKYRCPNQCIYCYWRDKKQENDHEQKTSEKRILLWKVFGNQKI